MKKQNIVLLSFLLLLYIVPSILAPSSMPAINMSKEFSMSTYGDESPQSITSFSETLADDVLFYPDGNFSFPEMTATGGNNSDYWRLNATDGVYWSTSSIILYFDTRIYHVGLEGFAYMLYSDIPDGSMSVYNYTSAGYDLVLSIASGWNNGTIFSGDYRPTGSDYNLTILLNGSLFVDYLGIAMNGMTLADIGHFAESFADVSDWTTSDTSISSDGDLGTITENGAGSTGRAYASMSSTDYFEYYYEFRISTMTATTANLEFYDGSNYYTLKQFSSSGTWKGIISDNHAATMQRIGFLIGSNSGNIRPDYLRISPANESGWSHDGSTTAGVTDDGGAGKTYTYSTDGDVLTLNVTHSASPTGNTYVYISTDATTTVSQIERDYYPFMAMRYKISSSSTMTPTLIWNSDGYYSTFSTTMDGNWHTVYLNHKASTTARAGSYFYIYSYAYASKTFEVEIDFIKAYSIANYTYTGTGVSTDDVLYVSSNTLYCSGTSFTSIVLDRDPALSVATATYNVWNVSTSSGTPQFDHYVAAWIGYSSETRGELTSGTLTDIRLKFTASANIAAIKFIDTKMWQVVDTKTVYIHVPYDYWALNMSLIFGGLIIMLLSTCIIAKKVRDKNISKDAGMILLLLFCVGWGLFIGGALIG